MTDNFIHSHLSDGSYEREIEKPDYAPEVVVDNTKEERAAKDAPKEAEQQQEKPHYHFGR